MISLQRKLALRSQAAALQDIRRKVSAVSRTTQAAHSSVAVGGADVPLVDAVQDATDTAAGLPFLEDDTALAGADAWLAWDQSEFAITLAERLDDELVAARVELDQALADAHEALSEAGLARSAAASAVADAQLAADAASKAVQDALNATLLAEGAAPTWASVDPKAADAAGKPLGAIWYVHNSAGRVIRVWELAALGWLNRPFDETAIPQVAIGSGTYGTLAGDRLVAKSVTAAQIQALAITANELAANSVIAVKIAANAVTAAKINAGAVTTDKLAALAVTAVKIAAGAIVADKIAAGAITTAKLAATAIDGMTITGALIRTAPSGQRLELDVNGLRAFNASGAVVASLRADSGGLGLSGSLTSWAGGTSPRATLSNGTLVLDVPSKPGEDVLEISPAGAYGNSKYAIAYGNQSTGVQSSTYIFGRIIRFAGPVEFQGDTDWIRLDGWTGGFAHSSSPVFYRKTRGYVEFRGYLTNSGFQGGWTSVGARMPEGFRPIDAVFDMPGNSTVVRSVRFDSTGALQFYGNVPSGSWWNFAQVRYPAEA